MSDVNKEIIEWVCSQPYWVQLAAKKIYAEEDVTDDLIGDLLSLLKTQDGQSKEKCVDLSGVIKASSTSTGDIQLVSVGNIEGIDALAPRSPLPFAQNLSVVYGHNGSGKSGYARILKRMCGKPNATALLPNVFKAPPHKRECTVVAKINGIDETFVWQANEAPLAKLLPIDIFDNQTGFIYIDKEQEVSYVPREVALFEKLVTVFQKLQLKLKTEKEAFKTKLPSRPTTFGNSKYITVMYERLKHDTDMSKVESFYTFTERDSKELASLEERLSISPLDLAVKKQNRITQIENLLSQISRAAALVSSAAVNTRGQLELDAMKKRQVAQDAADAISNERSFDGFGTEIWKAMWEAARKYSEQCAYPDKSYPVVEGKTKCVLCEQELGSHAKMRLLRLEQYVQGELESSATIAENALQSSLSMLPSIPTKDDLITALQAAQLNENKWLPVFNSTWTEIERVIANEKDKERPARIHFDLAKDKFQEIEALITEIKAEKAQHDEDAQTFDKNALINRVNDLKAKQWSSGYIQAIKDQVSQLQALREIDGWLKTVSTTAVSKESSRVSEILVTDAFVRRFNNELKSLGASKVSVELIKTRAKHGRVNHKIQLHGLNPQHNKSKAVSVLSEGEQRVVSLAAFLADVTSKPNSTPFVFDDPVSSFDQVYEEQTAKRLVELSATRQVIIFTHRLSLLGHLVQIGNAEHRHIRREPWGCGEHGEVPLFAKRPIKAINHLKNNRLSAARKAYETDGYESYYPLAKSICTDFRILLERIVECELLSDIVARHRRDVKTKNLIHNLAKITGDDCILIDELMSEFSKFEHSQSDDSPVDVPEPTVIESAIERIVSWHTDFSRRDNEVVSK